MTTLIFYAIRHIRTGKLMPARMWKNSAAGYTFWEPESPEYPEYEGIPDNGPRLFTSHRAAMMAKNKWIVGPLEKQFNLRTGEFEGIAPKSHKRKSGDLEVIETILTLYP